MGRTMPSECVHGFIFDWGDFGSAGSKPEACPHGCNDTPPKPEPRIGLNDDGSLDEFVAHNVSVHFEVMGDAQFWIGITDPVSGKSWDINCGALNTRAKGYCRIDEDL